MKGVIGITLLIIGLVLLLSPRFQQTDTIQINNIVLPTKTTAIGLLVLSIILLLFETKEKEEPKQQKQPIQVNLSERKTETTNKSSGKSSKKQERKQTPTPVQSNNPIQHLGSRQHQQSNQPSQINKPSQTNQPTQPLTGKQPGNNPIGTSTTNTEIGKMFSKRGTTRPLGQRKPEEKKEESQ